MTTIYSETDINAIRTNGFDLTLSQETIDIIASISDQVGAPSYIKTPIFPKSKTNKKKHISNAPYVSSIINNAEGVDKTISHIRAQLNKLSTTNYDNVRDIISENIQLLLDNEATKEELIKVTNFVLETASNNAFYSELYANLYSDLTERFPLFETLFEETFNKYLEMYDNITSFSDNDDYDAFCNQNIINCTRRAFTTFIVNLCIKGKITNVRLFDLCWKLQTYFDASILEENNKPLCDELCENIFIIMTKGYSCLKTQNKYASLNGKMTIVKNTNVNDVKSLTTKSKFRYYDMFDYVEKVEK
uniref:MIF4G domain-containing protein n=1 Tax=viral metagenome TaxID=1070528 RepID=A0A6C0EHJ4_9ZZZZ